MSDSQPPQPPSGNGVNDPEKSAVAPTPSTTDATATKKDDVEMKEPEEEPLPDEILNATVEE
jgi:hypothetical protein